MDGGAIDFTALFSRLMFGEQLTRKFVVLAAALAVASLGDPVAVKAQGVIKIDLPVTSIDGDPQASVGYLSPVTDTKHINTPGQSVVLETDKDTYAYGSVNILASPTPGIILREVAKANGGDASVDVGAVQLE
jgi:hypothetical protein